MSDEKFYNTAKFKKLNKQWSEKLKKSGFEDIEQEDGMLIKWASTIFSANYNQETFYAKESYYRFAGQFLYQHAFNSELEKVIWEAHSKGISVRSMSKVFKKRHIEVTNYRIREILNSLIKLMHVRYGIGK